MRVINTTCPSSIDEKAVKEYLGKLGEHIAQRLYAMWQ